jgi:uncharacterized protein (DUF362 family)
MNFNKVVIRKGNDSAGLMKDLLKEFPANSLGIGGRRVLIKPNAGRMAGPGLGINTSPDVIGSILDYFLESGIKNIAVGESPIVGVKALESLEMSGIAREAGIRGVELIDFDASGYQTIDIPEGRVIKKLRVCKEVLKNNFIVSVPVMKTHMHTQVSLGLKNMKGCLHGREKVKLHQLPPFGLVEEPGKPLDYAIADMAGILMPDFTIIDGTIDQEGMGPSGGSAKNAGLVIASLNCLAADTAAVMLMGFKPEEVFHLREAWKILGSKDSRYLHKGMIEAEPADFMKWVSPFEAPPKKISLEYSNVIVEDKDSCSACLSTVLMFLKRYYSDFADYLGPGKPLRIALGKSTGKQPPGTLLIGNCAIRAGDKEGGVLIKGCPPVSSQIIEEVEKLFPELKKKGLKINGSL